MLANALKSLHNFIFEENGDAKSDNEIVEKLDSLAKDNNLKPEISLYQYHNLFAKLKLEIVEKELKDKNKKNPRGDNEEKPKRGGKDWMPAERGILWFYINQAQEVEGLNYGEAEENISAILGKTTSGVRYKYYQIKERVDKGEDLQTVLSQARKGKKTVVAVGNNTVITSENTVKRGPGRPRKLNADAQVNSETQTVKRGPGRPKKTVTEETPVVAIQETAQVNSERTEVQQEIPKVEQVPATQNQKPVVKSEEVATTESTTKNASLSKNYQSEFVDYNINKPKADRSIFNILSSLINNFRVIGEEADTLNAKEELTNLLSGLETLSIIAASHAHNAQQQQHAEKRIAELEATLAQEKQDYEMLAKDFDMIRKENQMIVEEYDRKCEQRHAALEDAFKVFKNTHNHFFGLDEDRQIVEFLDYKERVSLQSKRMEEAIKKDKEIGFNSQPSTRRLVDIKDGILRTV
ncbi:hypothetical protein [Bacillus thuringiensis]|uniref:hypothetical protein n=1 Tax=Bacillus thuringiensis TaxID=1428 RepID=UPI0021D65734|nr:hypothetical protein [Bacillus thuringiensis]MCU7667984.1 hypothetical protein [Bacillus thuringiensis]